MTTIDPIRAGVLESITGALAKREGFRHLWLGDSGMGKTEANKILINWCLKAKTVDIVLTVDEKNRWKAQYEGANRINPDHLRSEPPTSDESTNHVVFRGVAYAGKRTDTVNPNDVGAMAWDLVRIRPCSVLVNIDELVDATNGHQTWSDEEIPQLYRKGRAVGLSVTATTQMPQLLPREAFGLPDTIGVFRLSGRESFYLLKYNVIEKEDVDVIENLQVGEFRMFRKSNPNDSNIYKFKL